MLRKAPKACSSEKGTRGIDCQPTIVVKIKAILQRTKKNAQEKKDLVVLETPIING